MEAKELRIGNLVLDKDNNIFAIAGILQNSVFKENAYIGMPLEWIKPIPLTEDYLLDFGFNHNEEKNVFELNGFLIYKQDCFWFDLISDSIEIEYIHQLQNLYFSLTNEELIKKL